MQVETYEVEEISGELGTDSESLELIDKLDLIGQKALANPATATRQPYRQMTSLERNVCAVLFPKKTKLRDYSDGSIPLRVLQVAAHAIETGLFSRIEVWGPETGSNHNDPVLVGMAPDQRDWDWKAEPYLLARWGDSLLPWDELAEKAKKLWIAQTKPATAFSFCVVFGQCLVYCGDDLCHPYAE